VPFVSLLVTFFIGLIVFLPFPSWQQLVGFVTSATVLSFGAGCLAIVALRREIPQRERPFRVPFGPVIAFLAFYSSNLIVYWAGWQVNWKLFVTIALGFVLFAAHHAFGKGEKQPLDLKAGASWTLPWLGGLCLISYLGDYPDQEKKAGNTAAIGFGWDFVAVLALTAIVYAIAYKVRLPQDRVESHIEDIEAETAVEQKELGSTGAA
jgi:amino acid transporter